MKVLRIVLLAIGISLAMPALLLVLVATLGFAGILADVGPAENRAMGWQALTYAAPFVAISLAFIASLFFTKVADDNRSDD